MWLSRMGLVALFRLFTRSLRRRVLMGAGVKKHEPPVVIIHFQGDPREWFSDRVMRLYSVQCDKVFIAVDHFIFAALWTEHRADASVSYDTERHCFRLPLQDEAYL